MTSRQLLEQEIQDASEPILREVYHFLRYLKTREDIDAFDGLRLSEAVLNQDWDTPEEDTAWANL